MPTSERARGNSYTKAEAVTVARELAALLTAALGGKWTPEACSWSPNANPAAPVWAAMVRGCGNTVTAERDPGRFAGVRVWIYIAGHSHGGSALDPSAVVAAYREARSRAVSRLRSQLADAEALPE